MSVGLFIHGLQAIGMGALYGSNPMMNPVNGLKGYTMTFPGQNGAPGVEHSVPGALVNMKNAVMRGEIGGSVAALMQTSVTLASCAGLAHGIWMGNKPAIIQASTLLGASLADSMMGQGWGSIGGMGGAAAGVLVTEVIVPLARSVLGSGQAGKSPPEALSQQKGLNVPPQHGGARRSMLPQALPKSKLPKYKGHF